MRALRIRGSRPASEIEGTSERSIMTSHLKSVRSPDRRRSRPLKEPGQAMGVSLVVPAPNFVPTTRPHGIETGFDNSVSPSPSTKQRPLPASDRPAVGLDGAFFSPAGPLVPSSVAGPGPLGHIDIDVGLPEALAASVQRDGCHGPALRRRRKGGGTDLKRHPEGSKYSREGPSRIIEDVLGSPRR
jgi:hypothetical protein